MSSLITSPSYVFDELSLNQDLTSSARLTGQQVLGTLLSPHNACLTFKFPAVQPGWFTARLFLCFLEINLCVLPKKIKKIFGEAIPCLGI